MKSFPSRKVHHSKIKKSIANKVSCSLGSNKCNPLLSNKGNVKQQDKEAFSISFDDAANQQKYLSNTTSPLRKNNCLDNNSKKAPIYETERKMSMHDQRPRFGSIPLNLKIHDEFARTYEETKTCAGKIKTLEKACSLNANVSFEISSISNEHKSLNSGYEISFKDIGRFIKPPTRKNSNENCRLVTVGDIQ